MIIIKPEEIIKEITKEDEFIDYLNQLSLIFPDHWILGNLDIDDIYSVGFIHAPDSINYQLYYYNDYDDYEDGIDILSNQWFSLISKGKLSLKDYL